MYISCLFPTPTIPTFVFLFKSSDDVLGCTSDETLEVKLLGGIFLDFTITIFHVIPSLNVILLLRTDISILGVNSFSGTGVTVRRQTRG